MKITALNALGLSIALALSGIAVQVQVAEAQDIEVDDTMEEVVVTGSRIRRDPLTEAAPILSNIHPAG